MGFSVRSIPVDISSPYETDDAPGHELAKTCPLLRGRSGSLPHAPKAQRFEGPSKTRSLTELYEQRERAETDGSQKVGCRVTKFTVIDLSPTHSPRQTPGKSEATKDRPPSGSGTTPVRPPSSSFY